MNLLIVVDTNIFVSVASPIAASLPRFLTPLRTIGASFASRKRSSPNMEACSVGRSCGLSLRASSISLNWSWIRVFLVTVPRCAEGNQGRLRPEAL